MRRSEPWLIVEYFQREPWPWRVAANQWTTCGRMLCAGFGFGATEDQATRMAIRNPNHQLTVAPMRLIDAPSRR